MIRKKLFLLNFLLIGAFTFIVLFTSCEENNPTNEKSGDDNDGSTISEGTYLIVNRNSGKALDVSTNTNNVLQWSYWGGSNQKWIISLVESNYYSLSPSSNTDHRLNVAGKSINNGATVMTSSFLGDYNQQWLFTTTDNEFYSIINRNSGKALDISASSTEDGADVIQWDTSDADKDQQWYLMRFAGPDEEITWRFTTPDISASVKILITAAMDAAVARYNNWGNWDSRTLTVEYNTSVPTADASIAGHIRFGPNTSYMSERTALHEMGHTFGVGTSSAWGYPLIKNSIYVGENAASLIKTFDGDNAVIHTDNQHFWPYGLNYESEMSNTNADRHVQLVLAMIQDGIYP